MSQLQHRPGGLGRREPRAAPDFDTASVADSLISEGTNDELDVRADENLFELRVVGAKLNQDYFSALPATFVSFDFFQHDTQAFIVR